MFRREKTRLPLTIDKHQKDWIHPERYCLALWLWTPILPLSYNPRCPHWGLWQHWRFGFIVHLRWCWYEKIWSSSISAQWTLFLLFCCSTLDCGAT